jgi:hypothetical protein
VITADENEGLSMRPMHLLLVLVLFSYTSVAAQAQGTFTATGDMTTARAYHTATLLFDGRVLIVGGDIAGTAELYDPTTGTFTPTGNGTTGHFHYTATLLPDGRVLIAAPLKSELYDPATGSFTPTGNMLIEQWGFTATLLTNGKVLFTGGTNGQDVYSDVAIAAAPQIYDPTTGAFSLAGPYADLHVYIFPDGSSAGTSGLTSVPATSLSDGKVLILSEPSAELYDPATNTFSVTGSMVAVDEGGAWGKPTQIIYRTATLMKNEKVLVAGGNPEYYDTGDFPLSRAELYDPAGTFTATNSMHVARFAHAATLMPDGTVLITGGRTGAFFEATALGELYNPSTDAFPAQVYMNTGRSFHQATLLLDGRVLVTGGLMASNTYPAVQRIASAELYTPAVLIPALVVRDLEFDQTKVVAGSSYSVNVSGSNLTAETFFDVRFISPGSNESAVVLNWQKGPAASHALPSGIAPGIWTINGVRAHEIETDHTGILFPVSATITVSNPLSPQMGVESIAAPK